MAILHLPACPICGTSDSLASQPRERSAYACQACGSVLVWLGDDFWLQGDRWVLQHVGREEMRHLQHRPLTVAELRQMAEQASTGTGNSTGPGSQKGIGKVADVPGSLEEDGEVVDGTFTVLPPAESDRGDDLDTFPPAREMDEARPGDIAQMSETEAALVPMAQVLPEGLALAIVRYEGSQAVPVAVFEEGKLRALDPALQRKPARRRSRGSPLLVIAVGTILMCLLCSLAVMLLPALRDSPLFLGAAPISSLPAVSPVPAAESPATIQGTSDYVAETGSRVIVGEVLNTSAYPLSFVQILARFYGEDGQPAGNSSTFAELATVEPGGIAPFRLDTQGLPPFARYDLRVDSSAANQDPLRLQIISQQASVTETGNYVVSGEVRNPYEFAVRFAEVVATYYDTSNQVLRVQMVLAEVDTLEPGQAAPFQLVLSHPPAELSYHKLQTQAVRP